MFCSFWTLNIQFKNIFSPFAHKQKQYSHMKNGNNIKPVVVSTKYNNVQSDENINNNKRYEEDTNTLVKSKDISGTTNNLFHGEHEPKDTKEYYSDYYEDGIVLFYIQKFTFFLHDDTYCHRCTTN